MKSKPDPHVSKVATADDRRTMMATLAHASQAELTEYLAKCLLTPDSAHLTRPPETGLVMIRGRQGGTGNTFNLGEATVTRATVQLNDGTMGVSYLLGRAPDRARLAAVIDAYWQQDEHRRTIEEQILAPIRDRIETDRKRKRSQTAATTVDFFTMVRGDD